MTPETTIWWIRRDLRLADNEALHAAVARGGPVVPVFVWAPEEEAPWAPGGAARWWLHRSLVALARALEARGARLVIRRGPTDRELARLAAETGATAIYWNRLYEPAIIARDTRIKADLRARGIAATSFTGALLHEPGAVATQQGKPYQVFTPFHRACQAIGDPSTTRPAPKRVPAGPPIASLSVDDLGLMPGLSWPAGLAEAWTPGEAGAMKRLAVFESRAPAYGIGRDRPDWEGTSRLSPHLQWGEIGPRQVWWAIRKAHPGGAAEPYLRQLVWREFAHHLLFHFPHTATEPLRAEFASFPWQDNPKRLRAWQRGQTGYPIVDAGMRELWRTGWMHNRARMIAASFLVKDLLIPWQAGAAWFWDTLVDANLANNTLGWQWTAGCGADAAPYFRIFNPELQGGKFDPDGAYVKRWIPELRDADAGRIHRVGPLAPRDRAAPGGVYPPPIVNHAAARDEALAAYGRIKRIQ